MITTSEIAVTITIWTLAATGGFFVSRAVWRRRKLLRNQAEQESAGSGRVP